jgi:hypothetical protein
MQLQTAKELMERQKAIPRLPGAAVHNELEALHRMALVFRGNAGELVRFLAEVQKEENLGRLYSLENRAGFDRFLLEVDRLLHNFVSSATSLVDHARRVQRKLLPEDPADDLAAEYLRRIEHEFKDAPRIQFVQDLRVLSVHRQLPVVRGGLSWSLEEPLQSRVLLPCADLLEWEKWSAPAREFIDAAGENIAIAEVVEEYAKQALSLHAWFLDALRARHQSELEHLRSEVDELAAAWKRLERD